MGSENLRNSGYALRDNLQLQPDYITFIQKLWDNLGQKEHPWQLPLELGGDTIVKDILVSPVPGLLSFLGHHGWVTVSEATQTGIGDVKNCYNLGC